MSVARSSRVAVLATLAVLAGAAQAAHRSSFQFLDFETSRTIEIDTPSGTEVLFSGNEYRLDPFEITYSNAFGTSLTRLAWSQVPYGLDAIGPPPSSGFGVDLAQGRIVGTLGEADVLRGSFENRVYGRFTIVAGAGEGPGQPVALTILAQSNQYAEGAVMPASVYQVEVNRLRGLEAPYLLYQVDTFSNPLASGSINDSVPLAGEAGLVIGDVVELRLRIASSFTLDQTGLANTPNPTYGAIFDDWLNVTIAPLTPVPEPRVALLLGISLPIVLALARRRRPVDDCGG